MIHPNEPPVAPEWGPEPHECEVFDLAEHARSRCYTPLDEVPDNIVLGEN